MDRADEDDFRSFHGRAVATAPGPGNRLTAAGLLGSSAAQARWPRSGLRVLWIGDRGTDTVAAAVLTQPSGALAVWGGVSRSASTIPGGSRAFAGLLPAGALDRTALIYRMPLPGHPVAVFVSGTRTVNVLRGGRSTTIEVTGGTVLPDGDAVTGTSVGSVPAIDVATLVTPPGLFVVKGI